MALPEDLVTVGEELILTGDVPALRRHVAQHMPAAPKTFVRQLERYIVEDNRSKALAVWRTVARNYVGNFEAALAVAVRVSWEAVLIAGAIGGLAYLFHRC